jgi:hypothetical protein
LRREGCGFRRGGRGRDGWLCREGADARNGRSGCGLRGLPWWECLEQDRIQRLQLRIQHGIEIALQQLLAQLQQGGIVESGGLTVLHPHQQNPVVHPEGGMQIAHRQVLQHRTDGGMGLADLHRTHQPAGETLLSERVAAGQFAEIGLIIQQPQVQLLGGALIAQADHAVHHLLEFIAALEEIGLHLVAIRLLHPFLEADLIPALLQRALQHRRLLLEPPGREGGGRDHGGALKEAGDHQRLLLVAELHRLAQALAQQVGRKHPQDTVLKQQLRQGLGVQHR